MKIIAFDTETTGYTPGNICQLSYIIDNSGTVSSKNIYFKVKYVEPGAQRVHGLSVEVLDKLSNGYNFAHHANEILLDFESSNCWISHNFSFDKNFIFAEFQRIGIKPHIEKYLCSMKYFTPICKLPQTGRQQTVFGYKYPRLDELAKYFGFSEDDIAEQASKIFNMSDERNFHDARVDTTAVYLCYKKALEMDLIHDK